LHLVWGKLMGPE